MSRYEQIIETEEYVSTLAAVYNVLSREFDMSPRLLAIFHGMISMELEEICREVEKERDSHSRPQLFFTFKGDIPFS